MDRVVSTGLSAALNTARRADRVLAVLLLATLASLALGEADSAAATGSVHGALGLGLLSLLKGVLVAREFMQLRGTALRWQAPVLGWLLLVLALVALAWRSA